MSDGSPISSTTSVMAHKAGPAQANGILRNLFAGAFYLGSLIVVFVADLATASVIKVTSMVLYPFRLIWAAQSWLWQRFLLPVSCVGAAAGFAGVLVGSLIGSAGVQLGLFGNNRARRVRRPTSRGSSAHASRKASLSGGAPNTALGHADTVDSNYAALVSDEDAASGSARSSLDSHAWVDWSDDETELFSSADESADRRTLVAPGRDFYVQFAPKSIEPQDGYPLYEDDDGYVTPARQLSRQPSILFAPIYEEE